MEPVPSVVTKTYPCRGPLQQFRFAESTSFKCFRCGQTKVSKLLTVYRQDWLRKLCNGCYGRLLSLYEIKAGTSKDDQAADDLAKVLLSSIELDSQRQAERLLRASDKRVDNLCAEGLRFIATAEHVASQLDAAPQLEWSPAVIGLCKAVEVEIVSRILRPLAAASADVDLMPDSEDKDIGRVASYCQDPTKKPPELGSFAHFLQTVVHSEQRRTTSPLICTFLDRSSKWTGSQWVLLPTGLLGALQVLTVSFRNRAAHIDELGRDDYFACREHVIGPQGMLWSLVVATEMGRHQSGH